MEDIWYYTKSDEYTFNLDAVKVQRTVLAPYRDIKGAPKDWQEENGKELVVNDGNTFIQIEPANQTLTIE